jgi:hypothetical protein
VHESTAATIANESTHQQHHTASHFVGQLLHLPVTPCCNRQSHSLGPLLHLPVTLCADQMPPTHTICGLPVCPAGQVPLQRWPVTTLPAQLGSQVTPVTTGGGSGHTERTKRPQAAAAAAATVTVSKGRCEAGLSQLCQYRWRPKHHQ